MDLKRAMQNWNVKNVDIVRSPELALRVFTGSERLANQMMINEIGEVGKLVKQKEMGGPTMGNLVRRIEMSDPKAGNIEAVGKNGKKYRNEWSTSGSLMKKIKTGDMKVGELEKSGDRQDLVKGSA